MIRLRIPVYKHPTTKRPIGPVVYDTYLVSTEHPFDSGMGHLLGGAVGHRTRANESRGSIPRVVYRKPTTWMVGVQFPTPSNTETWVNGKPTHC